MPGYGAVGSDGTGLELNEHRVCSRRACLIHPRTSLSKLGSDRPLAQALHVPRITVISPICDKMRVRTTCPGIMFRRVAVSAATSVRLRIRSQLARPGPWRSSDTSLEGEVSFWAVILLVVRGEIGR